MVAFTAMGEGTTGTPLHKGSEAQSVGAVQTPHQTEESISACACVCVDGWADGCEVHIHRCMTVYGHVFDDKLSRKLLANAKQHQGN